MRRVTEFLILPVSAFMLADSAVTFCAALWTHFSLPIWVLLQWEASVVAGMIIGGLYTKAHPEESA